MGAQRLKKADTMPASQKKIELSMSSRLSNMDFFLRR